MARRAGRSADGAALADGQPQHLLRRVAARFAPYSTRLWVLVGLILVTAGLGIVNPLLIERVFDDALFVEGGPDLDLLWTLVGVMLAITVATAALGVWQAVLTNDVGQSVMRDLRDALYRHLQTLSLGFYADARTGDLQSRITSDVGAVQTTVSSSAAAVLSNVVTFASAVIAMLLLSPLLTVVSVATIPFFVVAARMVGRRRRTLTSAAQASTAALTSVTAETLSVSGITLARLFGQREREIERFAAENRRLSRSAARREVIGQSFFTVVQAFLGATPVITYLVAGYLVTGSSPLGAGTLVAVTTLQNRLYFPVARLLETSVELQSSMALFERIFAYLDVAPEITDRPGARDLDPADVRGQVTLEGVRLRYAGGGADGDGDAPRASAVDGVSFVAEPGQMVALVGPSGAGKSSLLNLVNRLYDPSEGRVLLDGIDLRDIRLDSLARLVGVVTQDTFLLADTIRANLAYGRPDAGDDEIAAAARAAAIAERIEEFPDGYDTVVGERGFRLSGGERQRIAIARALLHDPKVLLLDEATSALDTASERLVQEALARLRASRTTLVVAHRLSTIQAADVIHVVDRGRIVESGDHESLLARGGLYASLYHEQFEDGTVEARCCDGVVMADGTHRPDGATSTDDRVTAGATPAAAGRS